MMYEKEVRRILYDILPKDVLSSEIGLDSNLQEFAMDSICFIKCVVQIENEFGIEFPDNKLLFTEANTIKKLCNIVAFEIYAKT